MPRLNPEAPRCVFCDRRCTDQNDLIAHRKACSEVVVEHVRPPIPVLSFDYAAYLDGYDGAPDAGWQPVGYGATKEAAIADLWEQIADRIEERLERSE